MEALVHRDATHRDIGLKLVLSIPIVIILIPALLYLASNDSKTAYEMLAIVVVIVIVIWLILPRQYLIFDDRLKIVLGGPLSFNVPFHTIKTARIPKGTTFGVNFPSSLSSKHVVEIVRNRRMSVTITPDDRDLFLKTLEKALSDWKTYQNRGVQ
jgi:hypothetical protein